MIRIHVRRAAAVTGLFVAFGFSISAFFPFLTLYLHGRGLRPDEIGLVIAVMAMVRTVANPIWGNYADTRLGRLRALQIGTIGSAVGAAAMNLASGPAAIATVAAVLSIFTVATGPNLDAIALVHLGDEHMSEYGRIRAWESLAYAAGCLLFGSILQAAGIRWAMPLFAVASVAVLAWSRTLERDRPADVEAHGRLGAVGAVFREAPRFWGFLAATLLVWTGFNAAWNFIALKIVSEGGGPFLVAIGGAVGALIEVPVMRLSPRLQSRWGLRRLYALGCCVYTGGFLLWGLISNPTVVSLLTALEGVAFALLFTTGIVVIGRLIPQSLYSSANAIAGMVGFGIAPILGAGIGGFVYQQAGAFVLYSGASALAFGGAVVAWFALATPALDEPGEVEPVTPPEPFPAT